jgi:type IV pilus assembly protein PilB
LVFSTLHTNDAPSAITRLIDIGVQPFLVASSVMAIMAQRLIRKVCPKCGKAQNPPLDQLRSIGISSDRASRATFKRGIGCNHCNQTGYRGRIGIYEMMIMNSAMRELTFRREPDMVLRRQARLTGMKTLFEDGVDKVLKGISTIEEVVEVAGMEPE